MKREDSNRLMCVHRIVRLCHQRNISSFQSVGSVYGKALVLEVIGYSIETIRSHNSQYVLNLVLKVDSETQRNNTREVLMNNSSAVDVTDR